MRDRMAIYSVPRKGTVRHPPVTVKTHMSSVWKETTNLTGTWLVMGRAAFGVQGLIDVEFPLLRFRAAGSSVLDQLSI